MDSELTTVIHANVPSLKQNLDKVFWTVKHLKYKSPDEASDVVKFIEELCNGVDYIVVLSRTRFLDNNCIRFWGIIVEIFHLVQTSEEHLSLIATTQIYERIETTFDNLLDYLSDESIGAEDQLQRFGFVTSILPHFDDKQVNKFLAEKLVLRIRYALQRLLKAYVFYSVDDPNEPFTFTMPAVNPNHINSFYFYCQLLEALITSRPANSEGWIEESVLKGFMAIEGHTDSLFQLLPNLRYVFYPTAVAIKRHVIKKA